MELLEEKSLPPRRAAEVAALVLAIVGSLTLALCVVHDRIIEAATAGADPLRVIAWTACYPLLTLLALALVLPCAVYVTDHAPFQSLCVLRPGHYAQVLRRVYSAWFGTGDGKLKTKDL